MLTINDEQRALGGLQYGTADWSDKFLEVLTVVGADNQQLCRSVVLSQIVQKAVVYGHEQLSRPVDRILGCRHNEPSMATAGVSRATPGGACKPG